MPKKSKIILTKLTRKQRDEFLHRVEYYYKEAKIGKSNKGK